MELVAYHHLLGAAGSFVFALYKIGRFWNLKQAKKTRVTFGKFFRTHLDDFGILFGIGQLLILGQFGLSHLAVFLGASEDLLEKGVQEGIAYSCGLLGTLLAGRLLKLGRVKLDKI